MTERVKQHYVPQFYFRNFARDERLCTYNLDSQEGYPPTSISNICYERYFYGDGEIEENLSELEDELASVLHRIVEKRSFEPLEMDEEARCNLDLFVTYTYGRTKAARKEASSHSQRLFETIAELGVETGELSNDTLQRIRNGEIRIEGPDHSIYQLISLHGPIYVSDLRRALIWNGSDTDFITSDHPVVFDNSRFKDEVDMNTTGFTSAGLQIFCPISNNLLLLYFDPNAYKIDDNSKQTVILKDKTVVEDLNKLQLLNCLENCYYRDESDSSWVDGLYQDVEADRPQEFTVKEQEKVAEGEQDRVQELVRAYPPTPSFTPDLPFLTQRPYSQFAPVRNPALRKTARSMIENALQEAEKYSEPE